MPYRIPGSTAVEPASLTPMPADPVAPVGAAGTPEEVLEAPPPPTASEGVHPFAISPEEGLPAIPQDQLLKKLEKLASLKAGAVQMYHAYADAVRAPFRDALFEHFEEHAKEERAGLYDVNMKLVALGGTAVTKSAKVPEAQGVAEILTHVMQQEKQLLKVTRELVLAAGDYSGLRLLLEESLLKDQRHLDDARRMLVTLP